MLKWHNRNGNICVGSVLKTNHKQHGVIRTIKPGCGMVEALWNNGEYHGYMRWIKQDGTHGSAVYRRGRKD